jgi:hypothetical protein
MPLTWLQGSILFIISLGYQTSTRTSSIIAVRERVENWEGGRRRMEEEEETGWGNR